MDELSLPFGKRQEPGATASTNSEEIVDALLVPNAVQLEIQAVKVAACPQCYSCFDSSSSFSSPSESLSSSSSSCCDSATSAPLRPNEALLNVVEFAGFRVLASSTMMTSLVCFLPFSSNFFWLSAGFGFSVFILCSSFPHELDTVVGLVGVIIPGNSALPLQPIQLMTKTWRLELTSQLGATVRSLHLPVKGLSLFFTSSTAVLIPNDRAQHLADELEADDPDAESASSFLQSFLVGDVIAIGVAEKPRAFPVEVEEANSCLTLRVPALARKLSSFEHVPLTGAHLKVSACDEANCKICFFSSFLSVLCRQSLMRANGIPSRYLGVLRYHISTVPNPVRELILTEMIARTLKLQLRRRCHAALFPDVKRQHYFSAQGQREVAISFFNLVYGSSVASSFLWTTEIKILLFQKYGSYGVLWHRLRDSFILRADSDLRCVVRLPTLFLSPLSSTGACLKTEAVLSFVKLLTSPPEKMYLCLTCFCHHSDQHCLFCRLVQASCSLPSY